MLERVPEGWFVRSEASHHGDISILVCRVVEEGSEWTGMVPRLVEDSRFVVQHQQPWWLFWQPSFEERVREAFEQAKKRAWVLNDRVQRAGQLEFEGKKSDG